MLRAVNVGGTGRLKMDELRSLCTGLGFLNVKTYIASGNVVFQGQQAPESIKRRLETELASHTGREIPVVVRTESELREAMLENPFRNKPPNKTLITFLDSPAPADAIDSIRNRADEDIHIGCREIFVHYGEGISNSKLRIPAAEAGTARNLNTVNRLADMAAALSGG